MMKKSEYKGIMIITSIMILLPMIIGVVLWDKLPSEIATHFGTDNQANGWSSKPMTVFGMPLLMLALQWFCFLITSNDPKKRNINKKMFTFVLWLVPIISLITMMSTYAMALGYSVDIGMIVNFLMGIVFIGFLKKQYGRLPVAANTHIFHKSSKTFRSFIIFAMI